MATLFIRNLPEDVNARIHRAASARQMTLAEYLSALVDLHDAVRARADAGDDGLSADLTELGLQTVVA